MLENRLLHIRAYPLMAEGAMIGKAGCERYIRLLLMRNRIEIQHDREFISAP
jgi:hypothetical protein